MRVPPEALNNSTRPQCDVNKNFKTAATAAHLSKWLKAATTVSLAKSYETDTLANQFTTAPRMSRNSACREKTVKQKMGIMLEVVQENGYAYDELNNRPAVVIYIITWVKMCCRACAKSRLYCCRIALASNSMFLPYPSPNLGTILRALLSRHVCLDSIQRTKHGRWPSLQH